MVVIVWQLDILLPMQSPHITTNVVSLNPAHDVYSMQHDVIKFVNYLRQLVVSSATKTDRHDITEILLNTTTQATTCNNCSCTVVKLLL